MQEQLTHSRKANPTVPLSKPAEEAAEYPDSLSEYFAAMMERFSEIESKHYPQLDREIGDALHKHYKPKHGSPEELASTVFKLLDAELGSKKTPAEAKNYKKILSAVQKAKLLHPVELTSLF